jgi:hypothetical protein
MSTTSVKTITTGKKTDSVKDGQVRMEYDNNRFIVADENGVMRMIIGILPDGTIGIVISKEGVDVRDVFI